LLELQRQYFTK